MFFREMSTLKDLAEGKPVNVLDVTVVKVLEKGKAIVGESKNSAALLITPNDDHSKKLLKESAGLKIIKPQLLKKEPMEIKGHDKFQLIQSKGLDIKLEPKLQKSLLEAAKTCKSETVNSSSTFTEIDGMELPQSIINKDIPLMVTRISKPQANTHGKYQMADVRDKDGHKNTLMVYGGAVGKMSDFEVYNINKLKRTTYPHEETSHFKLQTTAYSKVPRICQNISTMTF